MKTKKSFHWHLFFICLFIPLAAGLLSSLLTFRSFSLYQTLELPPLSPPSWLFPVVWTLLYILMGVSSYLAATSGKPKNTVTDALFTYGIQLFVNILWPLVFFNLKAYLLAFAWIVFLWILILRMILQFNSIQKASALLQIPYLLWCTFAAYLNLAVYILN